MQAGELDLALIYDHEALPEIAARELERVPLLDDVFRAVLPAGHRLARRRRPLELGDLRDEPGSGARRQRVVPHRHARLPVAGFTPRRVRL